MGKKETPEKPPKKDRKGGARRKAGREKAKRKINVPAPVRKISKFIVGFARILGGIACAVLFICFIGFAVLLKLGADYKDDLNGMDKEIYKTLADMDERTFVRNANTYIYDKDNKAIGKIGSENYVYAPITEISDYIQEAYIDVEDIRYLKHRGVDWMGIMRAAVSLVENRGHITQGGSSITQQVIKNNLLTQEQSFKRKYLEIRLAMDIEKEFTKSQIMEFYCNSNYYGNGCYGVEAASQFYFGKSCSKVDLAEAAMIAAISNSPSTVNPVADYELCMERKELVLKKLLQAGDITEEEFEKAKEERPAIAEKKEELDNESYMISFAVHDAALMLMKERGFEFKYTFDDEDAYNTYAEAYSTEYSKCEELIRNGGYRIFTSFDQEKQQVLQEVTDQVLEDEDERQDDGRYALQSASVIIDRASGQIVAAVGGRGTEDYFNRSYQAKRQSGSSIKPLLDYGPAVNEAVAFPGSVYEDKEVEYNGYSPKNYGGGYRGEMPVREALARSVNTVAVQLFSDTGAETAVSYLGRMRFSTLSYGDYYNSALSLGGFTNGVTVEDMAGGYACLQNEGVYRDPTCVKKLVSDVDNISMTRDDEGVQVFTKDTAFIMTDMMEGVFRESYGTAHAYDTDEQIYAGKSGTTDDNKDAWFAGYSAYYTMATWVGKDIPEEIEGMTGSGYPLQIWSGTMERLHEDLEKKEIMEKPDTVELADRDGRLMKSSKKKEDDDGSNEDGDDEERGDRGTIYDSRPSKYDYISVSKEKEVVENQKKREEKKKLEAAKAAVEEFEDYQITDTDAALALDDRYEEVMEAVRGLGSSDEKSRLTERAEYKYSLLSGEVKDAWMDKIRQQEEAEAAQKDKDNAEAAAESKEQAAADVRESREQVVWDYIGAINARTMYTSEVEDLISGGKAALSLCEGYSSYDELSSSLDSAASNARDLPSPGDIEARRKEAAEAQARKEKEEEAAAEAERQAEERIRKAEEEAKRKVEEEYVPSSGASEEETAPVPEGTDG